jgi:WD40 repeat protein
VVPVAPKHIIVVDPPCWMFDFTPDGSNIVTFSGEYVPGQKWQEAEFLGQLDTWNCSTGECVAKPITWEAVIPPSVLSADRRWWELWSVGGHERRARLLDITNRGITIPDVGPTGDYPRSPISPDGRFTVLQAGESTSFLWDLANHRVCGALAGVGGPFAFTSDSRFVAAESRSQSGLRAIRILEVEHLREIARLECQNYDDVYELAFSPDGDHLVALIGRRTDGQTDAVPPTTRALHCWEISTTKERYSIPEVGYRSFAFASGGELLVEWQELGKHRVEWFASSSGESLRTVHLDDDSTFSRIRLTRSPDGTRFIVVQAPSQMGLIERLARRIGLTAFQNPTVRARSLILDAHTGNCLGVIPSDQACWSPDGQTLATPMNTDRPIREIGIWDIRPRKPLSWFAAGATLLALSIAFVAHRSVRKLRIA